MAHAPVVRMVPRKNSRVFCSGCGRPGPAYDRLEERRFEFVPLWGILVFLAYRMRRVNCKRCGVTVEMVPWGDGKNQLTITYRWYLATWAKRLSWSEVGSIFRTSWDSVCRAVEHAVNWGLAHRDLSQVTALGVDEIAWARGHTYLTLVYDIGSKIKRLLAVECERKEKSLRLCLESLGEPVCGKVQYVCSDMWKPYLKVIAKRLGKAVHVLDRFHVMQQFGKALDKVRAEEAKQLVRDGYEPVLKKSRWCLLKRPKNLTDRQTVKLSEILKYNLRTVRAYRTSRGLPAALGVQECVVGWKVPGRMDESSDAFAAGTDDEDCPEYSESSSADPELVPGSRAGLGGGSRGP